MARITVDDCLRNVENRFDLILLAAQRARELGVGATPTVPRERDKPTLIALRELAAGTIPPEIVRDAFVSGLQRFVRNDDDESVPGNLEQQEEFAEYVRSSPRISLNGDPDSRRSPESSRELLTDLPEPSDAELTQLAIELGFESPPG